MTIAGNILNIIAPILQIISFSLKQRRRVLIGVVLASVVWVVAFLLLKAYGAAVFSGIGIAIPIINYFFSQKDKAKPWWLFAALSVLTAGLATLFYKSPVDVLPPIACLFLIFSILPKKPFVFRICLLLMSATWLLYGIFISGYGIIIGNALQILSLLAALIIYDILKRKRKDPPQPQQNENETDKKDEPTKSPPA